MYRSHKGLKWPAPLWVNCWKPFKHFAHCPINRSPLSYNFSQSHCHLRFNRKLVRKLQRRLFLWVEQTLRSIVSPQAADRLRHANQACIEAITSIISVHPQVHVILLQGSWVITLILGHKSNLKKQMAHSLFCSIIKNTYLCVRDILTFELIQIYRFAISQHFEGSIRLSVFLVRLFNVILHQINIKRAALCIIRLHNKCFIPKNVFNFLTMIWNVWSMVAHVFPFQVRGFVADRCLDCIALKNIQAVEGYISF